DSRGTRTAYLGSPSRPMASADSLVVPVRFRAILGDRVLIGPSAFGTWKPAKKFAGSKAIRRTYGDWRFQPMAVRPYRVVKTRRSESGTSKPGRSCGKSKGTRPGLPALLIRRTAASS